MDPALAVVVSTAITGAFGVVAAIIGAWVSVVKSEDRATISRLRKQVKSLGGDPDEE